MSESSVLDLSGKDNPPPDDEINAPYGWRFDNRKKEWVAKRSNGGRKSGTNWFGKKDPDPSFIDEYEELDPEPAYKSTTPKLPKPEVKVNKKIKDEITGAVGLIGAIVLPPIVAKDPYCGGALTESFPDIAEAVVPLLCKSRTVVAFFTDTGSDWMLWFKLAMVLIPVGMAVGKHHIVRTVEIQQDTETGELFAVPRDFSGFDTDEEVPDVGNTVS